MSYDYGIPSTLLQFLGACIFGDAKKYYSSQNEFRCVELKAEVSSFGLTAWFYRYLYDILSKSEQVEYRKYYQAHQVKAIQGEQELKRLYRVLAARGLRFVPIKGADLVYRLYPDAALRAFCDWDIWFHPDDCDRVPAVLAEDGWKVPRVSWTNLTPDQMKGKHHFLGHVRGKYLIEPHFTLAGLEEIAPHEIWDRTLDYPDGDGQRVLSPEMNLLMLTRHAATKWYFHAHLPKLLTDAAVVMQHEKVDFAALRKLANRWNLPYPGDLLAAFPEFFPADVIAGFEADPQKTEVFRKIFEIRGRLGKQETATLFLSQFEARGQIVGGVMEHIRFHTPEKMRLIYHLPEHGAWGRVALAYVCWFWTRAWRVRSWIWRNPLLREYTHIVEAAESDSVRES